jgi:sRNA-binding carbon storage regulator CsrA
MNYADQAQRKCAVENDQGGSHMLKLTLLSDEYITINGDIVVQLAGISGERAYLAINAARDIPIVRGTVLERAGGNRPSCLTPPQNKEKSRKDKMYRWNAKQENAAESMRQCLDRLEQENLPEAAYLRHQLKKIVPTN